MITVDNIAENPVITFDGFEDITFLKDQILINKRNLEIALFNEPDISEYSFDAISLKIEKLNCIIQQINNACLK